MAVGCNLQDGINTHGVALNIDLDTAPYRLFDPCGLREAGLGVGRLADWIPRDQLPPARTAGLRYAEALALRLAGRLETHPAASAPTLGSVVG